MENWPGVKIRGIAGELTDVLWLHMLNATLNLTVSVPSARGIIHANGTPTGIQRDLLLGRYDLQLNSELQRYIGHNEMNTFIVSGICYVSRRELLMANKYLSSIFSPKIWTLLAITFATIVILLKFMLGKSCVTASVEVLRAVTGVGMQYRPDSSARQLIFIALVFLFMTANFLCQGKLSALKTAPEYSNDVKTPMDLLTFDYTIYGESQYYQHFFGTVFADRVVMKYTSRECIDIIQARSKVACVIDCFSGKFLVPKSKSMRIMEDGFFKKYFVVLFRNDFALRKRVGRAYRRIYEAGITAYVESGAAYRLGLLQKTPQWTNDENYVITLEQLSFAFVFLQYLLIISSLLFVFEICFYTVIVRIFRLITSLINVADGSM